jgi:hypothetical protein
VVIRSRPVTKLALIVLLGVLVLAAAVQLVLASRDRPPYPGPVPGTPLPTISLSA